MGAALAAQDDYRRYLEAYNAAIARLSSQRPEQHIECVRELGELARQGLKTNFGKSKEPDRWKPMEMLLAIAGGDRWAEVRAAALEELETIAAEERVQKALLRLVFGTPHDNFASNRIEYMGGDLPRIRLKIAGILKKNAKEEVVDMIASVLHNKVADGLRTSLESRQDPGLRLLARALAAEQLGEIASPRAVQHLVAALKDPDWRIRHASVRALGYAGALEELKKVQDGNAEVLREAQAHLQRLQTKDDSKYTIADRETEIVFVFESTNSMKPDLDEVRRRIRGVVDECRSRREDLRIAFVSYKSKDQKWLTYNSYLSADVDGVLADLMRIEAEDGYGEYGRVALDHALRNVTARVNWSRTSKKFVYLFVSSPSLQAIEGYVLQMCRDLHTLEGVTFHTFACLTYFTKEEYRRKMRALMKEVAGATRGQFAEIGGNPVTGEDALVRRLVQEGDRLVSEKKYDEAIQKYDEALKYSPGNPDILARKKQAEKLKNP